MADVVDVRPDQLSSIQAILAAHVPSAEIWAFGSRAKWTARDTSDLDLAVVSSESLPSTKLDKLRHAFEQSYLPFQVDVVDLARVSDEFRKVIEKQKVVLRRAAKSNGTEKRPSEWRSLPLEDSVEEIIDYRGKTPRKVSSGIPLITAKVVKNGRIETPDEFIAPEEYDGWMRRGMPRPGDVLLTTEAPLGEVAQLDQRKVALAQRLVALRGKSGVLNNDFLKYLLQSKLVQDQLKSRASGTTVLGIKQSELRKVTLIFPPLTEQKAIAAVLGALDDRIELNRRMNATLEAIARALFQSWFVDFDPVRAKLDGGQPVGLDPATAALFPNEFEDSEFGPIPKGWRAGTVVEEFSLTMGQSPPGTTYNEECRGIPLYQGKTDFGFRFPTRRVFCTAPTRYANTGDTLVSVRAPVGDVNMANEECCVGRGVAAVRHKTGATSFTYYSMSNLYPDFARFEAEGTVFGAINKQSFENLPFVIPPAEVVAAYERQAAPLDEQIRILEEQSRTLAILRDTLLPKLLSGELNL